MHENVCVNLLNYPQNNVLKVIFPHFWDKIGPGHHFMRFASPFFWAASKGTSTEINCSLNLNLYSAGNIVTLLQCKFTSQTVFKHHQYSLTLTLLYSWTSSFTNSIYIFVFLRLVCPWFIQCKSTDNVQKTNSFLMPKLYSFWLNHCVLVWWSGTYIQFNLTCSISLISNTVLLD